MLQECFLVLAVVVFHWNQPSNQLYDSNGDVPLEPTLQLTIRLYGRLQKSGGQGQKSRKKAREILGRDSP